MQSPSTITFENDSVILRYPLIDRVSNSDTLSNFFNASIVNLIASNAGTDPLLSIPSVVDNYKSLKAYIIASAVWLCGTISLTTPRLNCKLAAYNNITPSSLLLKQNGQPLLTCLSENDSLSLNPIAGSLDFSQVSAAYSIDPSFNNTYWNPVTAFAAHSLQVYFAVTIVANGAN